jgi:hypothetical protein
MSGRGKERYNFNTSLVWDDAPDPEVSSSGSEEVVGGSSHTQHEQYRRVTAAEVTHFREPPRRVKMLVRDFIDDSLYNVSRGEPSDPRDVGSSGKSRLTDASPIMATFPKT